MKLSKEQTKNHDKAEELLLKEQLTFDDKYFVLENWLPAATNNITKIEDLENKDTAQLTFNFFE